MPVTIRTVAAVAIAFGTLSIHMTERVSASDTRVGRLSRLEVAKVERVTASEQHSPSGTLFVHGVETVIAYGGIPTTGNDLYVGRSEKVTAADQDYYKKVRIDKLKVSRSDKATISDSRTVRIAQLKVSRSESVTASETKSEGVITAYLPVSRSETVSASGVLSGKIASLVVRRQDSTTAGDARTARIYPLVISKLERVTAAVLSGTYPTAGPLSVSRTDNVTASAQRTVSGEHLSVHSQDFVSLRDPKSTVLGWLEARKSESVSVSDIRFKEIDKRVIGSRESISISDNRMVLISGIGQATKRESIAISDSFTVQLGAGPVGMVVWIWKRIA